MERPDTERWVSRKSSLCFCRKALPGEIKMRAKYSSPGVRGFPFLLLKLWTVMQMDAGVDRGSPAQSSGLWDQASPRVKPYSLLCQLTHWATRCFYLSELQLPYLWGSGGGVGRITGENSKRQNLNSKYWVHLRNMFLLHSFSASVRVILKNIFYVILHIHCSGS